MLADGHALEPQLAAARPGRDQREVGRAAPHVDDEHERMPRHPRPPLALVRLQPGVEGGLRLLEQDDVGKAGLVCGGERQLSGHLVERRGHGEHDVLRGERLGKRRIPRLAQVTENARGGLDRRDARPSELSGGQQQRL